MQKKAAVSKEFKQVSYVLWHRQSENAGCEEKKKNRKGNTSGWKTKKVLYFPVKLL